MGNFVVKPIRKKQIRKKKTDSSFNRIFALMVFAASLSKSGDDGKTSLSAHLPYKKTKTNKKQPPTIDI